MSTFHVFRLTDGRAWVIEHSISAFRGISPPLGAELVSKQPVMLGIAKLTLLTAGGELHRAGGAPAVFDSPIPSGHAS